MVSPSPYLSDDEYQEDIFAVREWEHARGRVQMPKILKIKLLIKLFDKLINNDWSFTHNQTIIHI